jgi:hypothetical protein
MEAGPCRGFVSTFSYYTFCPLEPKEVAEGLYEELSEWKLTDSNGKDLMCCGLKLFCTVSSWTVSDGMLLSSVPQSQKD